MRKINHYLGIPYKHKGRDITGMDCFGLLLFFYREQLGITLPEYEIDYPEDWYLHFDYFRESYEEYGFVPVNTHEFGDIILFRNTNKNVGHAGIIIDHEYFIHLSKVGCCINRYSTGVWHRFIDGVYRHKSMVTAL